MLGGIFPKHYKISTSIKKIENQQYVKSSKKTTCYKTLKTGYFLKSGS